MSWIIPPELRVRVSKPEDSQAIAIYGMDAEKVEHSLVINFDSVNSLVTYLDDLKTRVLELNNKPDIWAFNIKGT